MKDYLEIGCSPHEEPCVSVTNEQDYIEAMKHECRVFKEQLIRRYNPPQGVTLKVKSSPHDSGTYYEVVCYYENEKGENYAFELEAFDINHWDDQAQRDLNANEHWVEYWRIHNDSKRTKN